MGDDVLPGAVLADEDELVRPHRDPLQPRESLPVHKDAGPAAAGPCIHGHDAPSRTLRDDACRPIVDA
eukprot:CAMPEP_0168481286 /NCGR_PEP_ID=MMETSP0228-20121227/64433_1 /TAXON_ID=133427 /ORGANISM="Protoceratium reticulatum, Strain CCCM 535 (=CCMP 1889)" /LENGTH=67 /DNA_ID=CAMNT_0008497649 /DNA_START=115 /DNA_END=315 /DNA_ORIENTATION=-